MLYNLDTLQRGVQITYIRKRRINMTIKKFTVSKTELLFYLGEVVDMGIATEQEENIYYTYLETGEVENSKAVQRILQKMKKLHYEKY